MSDEAREQITIDAPPDACFASVCEFERYPDWASYVKTAEVVERDDDGRGSRVQYEVSAMGLTVGYLLEYDYSAAPRQLSWKLVSSDMFRTLDGSYWFDPDPSGADATAVTYLLLVDLALPLPGFVKKAAATMIAQSAMREFKKFVEDGG